MNFLSIKEKVKLLKDQLEFPSKLKRATPILVYQMGKVASSSIYHPLKKIYPGLVIHIHQFNQKCYFWDARHMHTLFTQGKQKKFKIISLIREPIGRNISEFFHRFPMYTGVNFDKNNFSSQELKDFFLNNIDHSYPLDWFDNNFKKHFGVDVYDKSFPTEGYEYYNSTDVEILLMRHDLSNQLKDNLVAKFVGVDNFQQEIRNVGSKKPYKEAYTAFKKEVHFSAEYLDSMKNSKYFKHFYDEQYINSVIGKWEKKN